MAETSTPVPPLVENVNITGNMTFTFEEQATSSCALYGLSLLCIIIGGIRSSNFVRKQMNKKRLIEASITLAEAKRFPITASMVLFGLYLFFKPDSREWLMVLGGTYLPEKYSLMLNNTIAKQEGGLSLFEKVAAKVPEKAQFLLNYIPEITKQHLMMFLLCLLCYEGCVALAAILKPFFSFILRLLPIGNRWPRRNIPYFLSVVKGNKEMEEGDIEDSKKEDVEYIFKIEVDSHDIIAILVCLSVGISHVYQRHWVTNNLLGVAFSIYGIENLHLSSFKAGTLLLCGLFIYDIFWVFATDVMTSVAKGIDAPILLQFPQDIYRVGWLEAKKYSMLGLGDIVIPGIFIALLRRFDQRLGESQDGKRVQAGKKGRFYFIATVVAYALGLFLTMFVMHHFKAAQPALLYLVPTCLIIPLLLATIRGEVSDLWNYNEEHLIEKKDEKKVSNEKKNN